MNDIKFQQKSVIGADGRANIIIHMYGYEYVLVYVGDLRHMSAIRTPAAFGIKNYALKSCTKIR